MSIQLKIFQRVFGLFLAGFLLIALVNFLLSLFNPTQLFLLALVCSFLVAYFMPVLFQLFSGVKEYKGKYREKVFEFNKKLGIKLDNVYTKKQFNGYAAAMGCLNHKSVLLGENLLNNFSYDEIEAVLAHETGHLYNLDVWIHTMLIPMLAFVASWIFDRSLLLSINPFLSLVFITFMFLLGYLRFNRWRESLADEFAKGHLKEPGNFAKFIKRSIELEEKKGNSFPKNPWYRFLFTHPWGYERIEYFTKS